MKYSINYHNRPKAVSRSYTVIVEVARLVLSIVALILIAALTIALSRPTDAI